MFWMLNCCEKSADGNFHYLFYSKKLITKAVSKGSPKNSIDCPTQLSSNNAVPPQVGIAYLILLTMSDSKNIRSIHLHSRRQSKMRI